MATEQPAANDGKSNSKMQVSKEPDKSPEELANEKKEEGNKFFTQRSYQDAIRLYSEAIDLAPKNPLYYSNRSAAYISINKYEQSLADAQRAAQLDPNFLRAHQRVVKCALLLADVEAADKGLRAIQRVDVRIDVSTEYNNLKQLRELTKEVDNLINKEPNDNETIITTADKILAISQYSITYKLIKANALLRLKKCDEANVIASDILILDNVNVEALIVRGLVYYYKEDFDKAQLTFKQALSFSPDHAKAQKMLKKIRQQTSKKEEGNEAYLNGKFEKALELYNEALSVGGNNSPMLAKLHFNIAITLDKLKRTDDALERVNQALELDPQYQKALMKRGEIYLKLEMFEEAVRDFHEVYIQEKTYPNKEMLDKAKAELKKSKQKDYYKVLGVTKSASDAEIKKAYKRKALVHHPDRHSDSPQKDRQFHELRFKDVGEAFAVLSNKVKRIRYDQGQVVDHTTDEASTNHTANFESYYSNFTNMSGRGTGYSF